MVRLILDSSSEIATVAVLEDSRILAERELGGMRNHAAILLPAIVACMEEAKVTLRDLDEILCCVGPGSFTGVRVGIATALGIAQPHGIPVRGFSYTALLLAYALEQEAKKGLEPGSRQFTLAMDAGRGEKYLWYVDLDRLQEAHAELQKGEPVFQGVYVEKTGLHSKLLFSPALPADFREQLILEDPKPIYFRLSQAEEAALANQTNAKQPNAKQTNAKQVNVAPGEASASRDTETTACAGGKCNGN